MSDLNPTILKEKTADLAFAARTVVQQMGSLDRTPEGLEAQRLIERALTNAIPDVNARGQGKLLAA